MKENTSSAPSHPGHVARGRAFAPSHITGFFQIFPSGSTGAGVNTDSGAITEVLLEASANPSLSITLNGEVSEAPVSRRVLDNFKEQLTGLSVNVTHEISYPIGYGMGMSGAGAFSLSLAVNQALGEPLNFESCLEIAKQAEIASGTGLGDVIAQRYHGVMIGLPPYPSQSVQIIPCDKHYVVCAFFAPLDTKSIIRDSGWKDKISAIGGECMQELINELTVDRMMELCRYFTQETGLANPQVREVMAAIPSSSMAMLGHTIFMLTNDAKGAEQELRRFADRIVVSKLGDRGAFAYGD